MFLLFEEYKMTYSLKRRHTIVHIKAQERTPKANLISNMYEQFLFDPHLRDNCEGINVLFNNYFYRSLHNTSRCIRAYTCWGCSRSAMLAFCLHFECACAGILQVNLFLHLVYRLLVITNAFPSQRIQFTFYYYLITQIYLLFVPNVKSWIKEHIFNWSIKLWCFSITR